MEGFFQFLKEAAVKLQELNVNEQRENEEVRNSSSLNARDESLRQSLYPSLQNVSHNMDQRNHQRRMQQREDDEEEWEVVGGSSKRKNDPAKAPEMGALAMGAIGIAALGLGAFALNKAFSASEACNPVCPSTMDQCREILRKIQKDIQEYPVVGLDCQWTQTFDNIRSPIALIQLASHKGNVVLIQLKKFSTIPHELRDILRSYDIIKTGIEGFKDARYLREDYSLEVRSTFDLRYLAEDTGNRPEGLEKLSLEVLDLDLGRDWELIKSDWDVPKLEDRQIAYGEAAVKASIDIFTTLYSFMEPNQTKEKILAYCQSNIDKPFKWYTQRWD